MEESWLLCLYCTLTTLGQEGRVLAIMIMHTHYPLLLVGSFLDVIVWASCSVQALAMEQATSGLSG